MSTTRKKSTRRTKKAAKKRASKKKTSKRAAKKKSSSKKKSTKKRSAKKSAGKKRSAKKKSAKKRSTKKRSAKKTTRAASKKSAKKRASKKKSGKKRSKRAASKEGKRPVGRPPGVPGKTPGSPKTHAAVQRIATLILDECAKYTRAEAATKTGLETTDIKNLKAGNLPGLLLILRLIKRGRMNPEALIVKNELKRLPGRSSVDGAEPHLIAERIRTLAKSEDAATLAEKTGLSINTIYQQRVANRRVGLHAVLAFIDAGASPNFIFFGKK